MPFGRGGKNPGGRKGGRRSKAAGSTGRAAKGKAKRKRPKAAAEDPPPALYDTDGDDDVDADAGSGERAPPPDPDDSCPEQVSSGSDEEAGPSPFQSDPHSPYLEPLLTKFRPNPPKLSSRTTADLHQPPFRATAAVCRRLLGRGTEPTWPKTDTKIGSATRPIGFIEA